MYDIRSLSSVYHSVKFTVVAEHGESGQLLNSVALPSPQVVVVVPFVTAVCDLVYAIAKGRPDVAHYQYLSPAFLAASMVSESLREGGCV